MRLSGENWGSGAPEYGFGEGHRTFTVLSGDSLGSIEALSSCGCPGCLSNLERKMAGWDAAPGGEVTRTDGGGPFEADESAGVDSVGNTVGTASTLAIGASTNGFVHSAGDRDWYAVTMVAGQSYTFTLNGTTLTDPYLEIYNSSGTLIGFDDDFGSGINAQLRWTATESGTYYINAQAFPDSGLTGGYSLTAATSSPASPLDSIDYHYTMPTTNISIWFSTPGYTNPSGDATVRSWTQPEIDAVMAALATYSAITPLTFSVAANQGAATWIFTLADLPGNTLGYFAVGAQYSAFDPNVADFTAGLTPGGNSWVTIIHEAGHGLGMAHPHDNGAEDYGPDNSEVMQGVTDAFESFGSFNLNQGVFTTMTYNDGWRTSGFGGPPSNLVGGQATPMALDIALMQQRYGVNPTTGSGNTAYTLALTNSAYRSIWDVGGTDTISYAGSGNATIDLRAATLLNAVGGGGYVSFVQGVHGGWTIANGVVIENATGGSGNDTLIGNDASNILTGGAGVDNMSGGLGDDTYYVDNASDVVTEGVGAGTDTVISSTSYNMLANIENLTLAGPGIEVHGTGNALNNIMIGDNAVNGLQGLGGNDRLVGNGGNDQLLGGDGIDTSGYSIASTSATWTRNPNGTWTVTGEGTDTLTSVEVLDFTNRDVVLDNAQQTFSGDGTSDILWRRNDGLTATWAMNGTAQAGSTLVGSVGNDWSIQGTGDFSGDGRDDILWQRNDGLVYLWNNASSAGAVFVAAASTAWDIQGVGDFNFDGRDDFLWRNPTSGQVAIWTLNGSTVTNQAVIGAAGAEWSIQTVADFSGDGRDDILWRRDDGLLAIWNTDGSGVTGSSTLGSVGADWVVAGSGDFNGDGYADILWQRNDGLMAIWEMNNTGLLASGVIGGVGTTWHVADVGDYNGDGRDDIFWRDDSGLLAVWTLNGFTITSTGVTGSVGAEWGII